MKLRACSGCLVSNFFAEWQAFFSCNVGIAYVVDAFHAFGSAKGVISRVIIRLTSTSFVVPVDLGLNDTV